MAKLYCRNHHRGLQGDKGLCPECAAVVAYAAERTNRCPHLHKGICETCAIQCYKPEMRQNIRQIMTYSGPRMLIHHPLMAIRHLIKKITLSRKEKV